eukprot:SAG22_NODE_10924_length_509_cov_1.260976_1_plen_110_part_01
MADAAFFGAAEIRRSLPVAACIDAVARALAAYSAQDGQVVMPVRSVVPLPLEDKIGILSTMPCYMGDYAACKTITVFPGNAGTALSAHQGECGTDSVSPRPMQAAVLPTL